jgi:hypothetical protein
MIVDIRTYTCHAHRLTEWIALYKEEAWPIQQKYLGKCRGWYVSTEGKLNTVIHIWEYDSQADRETRRTAMYNDPSWQNFVAKSKALGPFVSQENTLARPADFYLAGLGAALG